MIYPLQIKTIKEYKETDYKEKKSIFIAGIYPVQAQHETDALLKAAKKKFFDASHHCFAFKLADGTCKSSDAGEPGGTAGSRILNAIEHFEINNTLLIVVRYFGGVKLGKGPLSRAYYNAAHEVIQNSEIIIKKLYQKIKIIADFEHLNAVHKVLSNYHSRINKTDYITRAEFDCSVTPDLLDIIKRELNGQTGGKVNFQIFEEYFYL